MGTLRRGVVKITTRRQIQNGERFFVDEVFGPICRLAKLHNVEILIGKRDNDCVTSLIIDLIPTLVEPSGRYGHFLVYRHFGPIVSRPLAARLSYSYWRDRRRHVHWRLRVRASRHNNSGHAANLKNRASFSHLGYSYLDTINSSYFTQQL